MAFYDYVSVRLVRKSFDGILNYQLKSTISSKDRKHLRKSLSTQKLSASKDQPITKTLGRSRLTKRGTQSVFCLSELSDQKSQTGGSWAESGVPFGVFWPPDLITTILKSGHLTLTTQIYGFSWGKKFKHLATLGSYSCKINKIIKNTS